MKIKKTDFDNLHVGHRIYVMNDKEARECAEKVKEKGFGYSVGTDFGGSYIKVEEKDYDPSKAKENEVEAYGMMIVCGLMLHRALAKQLSEHKGLLGVQPIPGGIISVWKTENDMKIAYNLLSHKGWKCKKIGVLHIPKEYADDVQE